MFWLKEALSILDSDSLGWKFPGPPRAAEEALPGSPHDDFLSEVFIQGVAPRLAPSAFQVTGPPYGNIDEEQKLLCSMDVVRAMVDTLYFNDNPAAPDLPDDLLDYWNGFLETHNVPR